MIFSLPACLEPSRVRDAGLEEWKRRIARQKARRVEPTGALRRLIAERRGEPGEPGAIVDVTV